MDRDIKNALDWFLGFFNDAEWHRRMRSIEDCLNLILAPKPTRKEAHTLASVSISEDRICWYLYLVHTALYAPHQYEPTQGSRILPIFKRLGMNIERVKEIKNINDRVAKLISNERAQPDSGLFELLVALNWSMNGWNNVELLNESPPVKRPDIQCTRSGESWYVECKRLSKTSDYSESERQKWHRMWRPLSDFLIDSQLPFLLDIIFHVELENLDDDFIKRELTGKLKLVTFPCLIISNQIWTVRVEFVDIAAARVHLKRNYVKYPSDQLNLLIAGRRDPNRGFTAAIAGKFVRIGEGGGNNQFLDSISFAAGAFWHCDAPQATRKKARDIRRHLAEAVSQLPSRELCAVHIGLETLDGHPVEAERYRRICDTVFNFDARGKKLRWVYCHLFQSYAPPDQAWAIDETVYYFGNKKFRRKEPLISRTVIVPAKDTDGDGVHWLKSPP